MITLTHSDPAVCEAVLATIKGIWPEAPCVCGDGDQSLTLQSPPQKISVLVAQIQTMSRQSQWPATLPFNTLFGLRILDTRMREWQKGDEVTILTEKEVGVLLYLWQRKVPVTREDLLRDIWQYAHDADTHTIETHIYRLRQKIEPDPANPQFLVTGKDGYCLA